MTFYSVAASADDAWEDSGGNVVVTDTDPSVGQNEWHGLRFANITVPQNATILTAHLNVYLTSSADDSPDHRISGDKTDDSAQFNASNSEDISGRTVTSANVTWSDTNLGGPGEVIAAYVTTIVQEIVNRPGWASGNALSLLINGNTSGRTVKFEHADHANSNPPKLWITYATSDTDLPTSATSDSAGLQTVALREVDSYRTTSDNAGFSDSVNIGRILNMAVQTDNLGGSDAVDTSAHLQSVEIIASSAGFADNVLISVNYVSILVSDNLGFGTVHGPPDLPAPTPIYKATIEQTVYFTQEFDEKQTHTSGGSTIQIIAGERYRR